MGVTTKHTNDTKRGPKSFSQDSQDLQEPVGNSVLLSGHFVFFVHVFRPNSFPGLLLACLVFLRFLFSCLAVPWGSNSFGCGFAALWSLW